MRRWRIISKAGQDHGGWPASTAVEALASMHVDAGYQVHVQGDELVFPDTETRQVCGGIGDWTIKPAPVTFLDCATARLGRPASTGSDFEEAGLEIIGGCRRCEATLSAGNGCPSRSGWWHCEGCLDLGDGYESTEEFWRDWGDAAIVHLAGPDPAVAIADDRLADRWLDYAREWLAERLDVRVKVVPGTLGETRIEMLSPDVDERSIRLAVQGAWEDWLSDGASERPYYRDDGPSRDDYLGDLEDACYDSEDRS